VGAATAINAGEGFTMKGTSGNDTTVADAIEGVQNNAGDKQRYDFRGKPNDGNMAIAVSAGNFTLVGNPYPSAIDLNAYLLDPANAALINGQAYFSASITKFSIGVEIFFPLIRGIAQSDFREIKCILKDLHFVFKFFFGLILVETFLD
jgi:hypothetical protein